MTLNTFHFAGRGEMNVTLGIPRLREILMVASSNIKTPHVVVPVLDTAQAHAAARKLARSLTRITLAELLQTVEVGETFRVECGVARHRVYSVTFHFLSAASFRNRLGLGPNAVLRHVETRFIRHLLELIKRKSAALANSRTMGTQRATRSGDAVGGGAEDDDDDGGDGGDGGGGDGGD
ncbi:DNA-directed RNA polymerase I subunit RPA1-like, partial [Lampetra fluviatilis]